MTYICIEHQKAFKGPNKANKYWHLINYATQEYHSVAVDEVETVSKKTLDSIEEVNRADEETGQRILNKSDGYSNRQSLIQTAYNNATNIVSALISIKAYQSEYSDEEMIAKVSKIAKKFISNMEELK